MNNITPGAALFKSVDLTDEEQIKVRIKTAITIEIHRR